MDVRWRCAITSREAAASAGTRWSVALEHPDRTSDATGTSTAVPGNRAVIMQHGWRNWLGVFAAVTALAGGLASIFHRENATVLPQEFSDRCSDACPCGTI